jgi:hypothetical protein
LCPKACPVSFPSTENARPLPKDYNTKVEFYQWFLQIYAGNPFSFLPLVLFTEDTGLRRNVIVKFQSSTDADPRGSISSQEQFAINIRVGMIGDTLARPSVLRQRLVKA